MNRFSGAMNIAISYFHGLTETHEFFMKILSWLMKFFFMAMKICHSSRTEINGSLKSVFMAMKIHEKIKVKFNGS